MNSGESPLLAESTWKMVRDAQATAEKGARFFEAVTQQIGGFLVELAKSDREDLYE